MLDLAHPHASRWVDIILFCFIAALGYGVVRAAARWSEPLAPGTTIDLSPSRLPLYAGLSTLRMAIAYIIALVFSLAYARIAAASRSAERVMIPLLDILQSIPILSFMPGVVLGLVALFPGRTIGLEFAAIILIFTSQAWNLAFSFHQSLRTIPPELSEAATVYRLGFWRRFTRLELPFGAIALIANSMMSWAGGWFFLMASEQFTLGNTSLRLPGLGSYLATAAEKGDIRAITLGLIALIAIIVLLDQLLWRPLVAWSDLFKFEQSASAETARSVMLDLLRISALIAWIRARLLVPVWRRLDPGLETAIRSRSRIGATVRTESRARRLARNAAIGVAIALVLWGAFAAAREMASLSARQWGDVGVGAAATFLRTSIALALGAAWTIPAGVAIGMNPRWSRRVQPVIQVVASVPATALFPVLLLALLALPGGLDIAAVALMLLGTQWYVLFNVIAGAMSIPSELKEAAINYRVTGWRRWRTLILPAIFPYLVTGMLTATGGAWNASIISEYVSFAGRTVSTVGLGSLIAGAADRGNFPLLLAATLVMAGIVIAVNRLVWRRLYVLAESRYRLQ
ncbi:MAG TPA: ABC transporter permease subunit [Gemmatimonadaceae bacterium]